MDNIKKPSNLCEQPCCSVCGISMEYKGFVSPCYFFTTTCQHKEIASFKEDGTKLFQTDEHFCETCAGGGFALDRQGNETSCPDCVG